MKSNLFRLGRTVRQGWVSFTILILSWLVSIALRVSFTSVFSPTWYVGILVSAALMVAFGILWHQAWLETRTDKDDQ